MGRARPPVLLRRCDYHRPVKFVLDRSPGPPVACASTTWWLPTDAAARPSLSSPRPLHVTCAGPPPNSLLGRGPVAQLQGISSRNAASTGESSPVRQAADSATV